MKVKTPSICLIEAFSACSSVSPWLIWSETHTAINSLSFSVRKR